MHILLVLALLAAANAAEYLKAVTDTKHLEKLNNVTLDDVLGFQRAYRRTFKPVNKADKEFAVNLHNIRAGAQFLIDLRLPHSGRTTISFVKRDENGCSAESTVQAKTLSNLCDNVVFNMGIRVAYGVKKLDWFTLNQRYNGTWLSTLGKKSYLYKKTLKYTTFIDGGEKKAEYAVKRYPFEAGKYTAIEVKFEEGLAKVAVISHQLSIAVDGRIVFTYEFVYDELSLADIGLLLIDAGTGRLHLVAVN